MFNRDAAAHCESDQVVPEKLDDGGVSFSRKQFPDTSSILVFADEGRGSRVQHDIGAWLKEIDGHCA